MLGFVVVKDAGCQTCTLNLGNQTNKGEEKR